MSSALWECTVCGYIYDPEIGDPEGGIDPDTPFVDLPDSWVCPECGADKSMFEKLEGDADEEDEDEDEPDYEGEEEE